MVRGKTTILDAITFALYNKPYRDITKPQIINTINNKQLLVEIEFSIGSTEYVVKRGIKPTVFEIYSDGKLLDQSASSRDYQSHLENNILKLNYKSFCQLIVLGSTSFIPFMKLAPAARRVIIEDILDLEIFTNMNNVLKDKISENKKKLSQLDTNRQILESKITTALEYQEKQKNDVEKTTSIIQAKIDKNLIAINDCNASIKEWTDARAVIDKEHLSGLNKYDVKKKISELDIVELEYDIKKLEADIEFYQHTQSCSSCGQDIDESFKEDTIQKLEDTLSRSVGKLKSLNTTKASLEADINTINDYEDKINELTTKINQKTATVYGLEQDNKDASTMIASLHNDVIEDSTDIDELEENLKKTVDMIDKREYAKSLYGVAQALLKDTGIKASIIKQYVELINKIINDYLTQMEFFVKFELSESFEETIKSRYRDTFSYASFSEGEKTRINLAVLFTWRAITKMRNSTTSNLLIFDEVLDSSTDKEGLESFFDIIKTNDIADNIFVISHTQDQYIDKFDNIIKFKKVKNFSIKEE